MALASGSYFRDMNLDLGNKDMSNPSASSSAGMNNPYRTGDYYTVSGRSNASIGLGKIIVYGGLAMIGYWLFKKIAG